MNDFSNGIERVRQILEPAVAAQDPHFFESDEQTELRRTAQLVYGRIVGCCDRFLGLVCGRLQGEEIGVPQLGTSLSIPSRLYGKRGREALDAGALQRLDEAIRSTFHLGLATHLTLQIYPTRKHVDRVDGDDLLKEFAPEALVATQHMSRYDSENNGIPRSIYERHFGEDVEPFLKEELRLGFWKMGKADANFTHLFFSGALLGLQFDLRTGKG